MPSFYLPPENRGLFFTDIDGKLAVYKDEDAVETYTLDFTDVLDSGDTIASVAYKADGVTLNSSSNTTTTISMTVAKTGGDIQATVTTTAGAVLVRRLRFVESET